MVYVAGSSEGKFKSPLPFVGDSLASPFASLVTETLAPTTSCPDGSTTVPDRVPVVVWADTGTTGNTNSTPKNNAVNGVIVLIAILLSSSNPLSKVRLHKRKKPPL